MRSTTEILIGKPSKEWTLWDFWKLRLFVGAAGAILWGLLLMLLGLLHSAPPLPSFLLWAIGALYALILSVAAWIATAQGDPLTSVAFLFQKFGATGKRLMRAIPRLFSRPSK